MLSGDAGENLPPAFLEFIRLFNARDYWESHEVLEQPWRANRSDFYQGLIIFASAFVHAQRGNPVGIRKQMTKVFGKLEAYRPHYMGIDVEAVLEQASQCIEFVTANPELRDEALTSAVPYPELHPDPLLVRGNEQELAESHEQGAARSPEQELAESHEQEAARDGNSRIVQGD